MTIRRSAAPVVRYSEQYRHFSRAINLFLWSGAIEMLGMQIALLFTNFYLLALHQDAAFIGLYNAIPSLMTVLLGLPVGLLSDRLGPRRATLIGLALETLGLAGLALGDGPLPLFVAVCVQGAGHTFVGTNGGPFMMVHSRPEARSAVFSLQSALGNATGFIGNLIGGYVPLVIALALGGSSDGLPALRGTLLIAVVLTALAALPMVRIAEQAGPPAPEAAPAEDPHAPEQAPAAAPRRRLFSNPGLVARLLVPGTLIGLGAGMNMPVLNLFVQGRFGIDFNELGLVFALAAVGTMVATLLQPLLAGRVGRVRSTLLVQALSLPFLVIMGFVPIFPLVVLALVVRGALMNMGNPIFLAFAMEQVPANERARFSSLDAMLWSGGWALGSGFSGWWRGLVGFDAGFNTTFTLMTLCYIAGFVLLWWWFDRAEAAARRTSPQAASLGA